MFGPTAAADTACSPPGSGPPLILSAGAGRLCASQIEGPCSTRWLSTNSAVPGSSRRVESAVRRMHREPLGRRAFDSAASWAGSGLADFSHGEQNTE